VLRLQNRLYEFVGLSCHFSRVVDSDGNTPSGSLKSHTGCPGGQRLGASKHCTRLPVQLLKLAQSTLPSDFPADKSAPGEVNVSNNAAHPKAEAFLKFPKRLKERPGQVSQEPCRTRAPLHQTRRQSRVGLLFRRDGVANPCWG